MIWGVIVLVFVALVLIKHIQWTTELELTRLRKAEESKRVFELLGTDFSDKSKRRRGGGLGHWL